ncbi:tyrosinase family protein [Roseibium marinum]|uniref:Tyrosinase n=1 Tax=Roseibium marinum TaxID=281252 RepID=A0A2S3UTK6_9HYPH|nr:tyrosinase family protein [Roseibium marinum]POF31041.1 tyrosinase [Roseibium marinum]
MTRIRKDIAKLNGPWPEELLWYARAVAAMRARPFADRTSWLYFGAIHGFDQNGWIRQNIITAGTAVPPDIEQRNVLNQCQHAGWFFLPWHRGYLAAFEALTADWIAAQGGPDDWALPYWNYLDSQNQDARKIPAEFLADKLPDGTDNPLSAASRGGLQVLGPMPRIGIPDINLDAQSIDIYTAVAPGVLGYGGPVSRFAQQGNSFGGIEANPHGPVHVMIGGVTPTFQPAGWMTDPDYAALDPVFWLHHCNIDRLWEAWLSDPANSQEVSGIWKNGPFPRQFLMPTVSGGIDVFTPGETLPGGPLAPLYDDLEDGTGIVIPAAAGEPEIAMVSSERPGGASREMKSALMGSNTESLEVGDASVSSRVGLRQTKMAEAAFASPAAVDGTHIFLNLEGVRGSVPTGALLVSLAVPSGPGGDREIIELEPVVLFGLGKASSTEGSHAGNGFTVAIDITSAVSRIQADGRTSLDALEVTVAQPKGAESPITVDRISIYRQISD